jgi:hypothetical protein
MVFPIGAQIWELAADHLDRLPGKSLIDRLVHQSSVADDDHAVSANEPQDCAPRRRIESNRNSNDVQPRVELRRREAVLADLKVAAVELSNHPHANSDEDDGEEKSKVREECVDAQHDEDDGIVAREVAEIVVNTRLHLSEITRLRQALDVEELGDRPQVGEPGAERSGAQSGEAVAKVQARRQDVYRDLNSRHGERIAGSRRSDAEAEV